QFFAFFLCCSRIRHTRFSLDWSADVCSSDLFVEAGRALGMSPTRILFRHVLINSWAPALVIATLGMGTAIVAEASLSFLGLGTQPPQISWGRMLSVGREAIRSAPHVTLYPGVAITLTVLGFSLLGDGLRDVFDRRLADR